MPLPGATPFSLDSVCDHPYSDEENKSHRWQYSSRCLHCGVEYVFMLPPQIAQEITDTLARLTGWDRPSTVVVQVLKKYLPQFLFRTTWLAECPACYDVAGGRVPSRWAEDGAVHPLHP